MMPVHNSWMPPSSDTGMTVEAQPGTAAGLKIRTQTAHSAVHRLVLEGRAPELAAFYPSAGGVVAAGARDAFVHLLAEDQHLFGALRTNPWEARRFLSTIAGSVAIPDFFDEAHLARIIGEALPLAA